jgi:type II pantothenate kinase
MGRAAKRAAVGVDAGATLLKIVLRAGDGSEQRHLLPGREVAAAVELASGADPASLGITGGGAEGFTRRWIEAHPRQARSPEARRCEEFESWAAGARSLIEAGRIDSSFPFLLASVGTGTSVLLVNNDSVHRVGGTALGGGTFLGLVSVLAGARDFATAVALAAAGDRKNVDLLVKDVYHDSKELPLPGDINAASFGKVTADGPEPVAADLANSAAALVAENIALLCHGMAVAAGVDTVVYGGGTLRDNPALVSVLTEVSAAVGLRAVVPANGEFTGALGALKLAEGL